jgi:hypothetical protein
MIIHNIYEPDPAIQDEIVELLYNFLTQRPDAADDVDTVAKQSGSITPQHLQ